MIDLTHQVSYDTSARAVPRSAQTLSLRQITREDVGFLYGLAGVEPLAFGWRFGPNLPPPRIFADEFRGPAFTQYAIVDIGTRQPVGVATAYDVSHHHGVASLAVALVEGNPPLSPRWTEATRLFIDNLFGLANLRKVYARLPVGTAYDRPEWLLHEGCLTNHVFYRGRFRDEEVLAVYRPGESAPLVPTPAPHVSALRRRTTITLRPTETLRFESQRVALDLVTDASLPFLYELSTSPEVGFRWQYGGADPGFSNFAASLWNGVLAQFVILDRRRRAPIGLARAYHADASNAHAHLGLVMTPDAERGLGVEAALLLAEYLVTRWPFRKLYLEAPEYNVGAFASGIGSLLVEEARLRNHYYYDGRYWDRLVFAVNVQTNYGPPNQFIRVERTSAVESKNCGKGRRAVGLGRTDFCHHRAGAKLLRGPEHPAGYRRGQRVGRTHG